MTFNLLPLFISLKVSFLSTIITFILGVIIAYIIYNYQGKFRSILETIFLIPLVLPPTVIGFILLVFFGKNTFIGQIFAQININIVFSWYGAVVATVVIAFPLMFRASLGAFEQIDPLILDAARLEGAPEIAVFFYIAIPIAIRGILSGIALSFTRILGEFGATLMVAGNIPNQTQTMPMAVYFAVQGGALQEAWFWSFLLIFLSLGIIFFLNQFFQLNQK